MALSLDLVDETNRDAALAALVRDIEGRNYALTSGEVGFYHVIKTLQREERNDIIYAMNRNAEIPGYAYQLKMGATALTESWQAYDNVSHNHFMLGHLMEWLYGSLGGIRQSSDSVARKRVVIEPQMVGDITWAKTSLKTPAGQVACFWERSSDQTKWKIEVDIPNGTAAEVSLPDGRVMEVEAGHYIWYNAL